MKNRKTNGMKWQDAQAGEAGGGMANVPALPVPAAGVPVVPDVGTVQAVPGQVMPVPQTVPPDAVSPLQTPQGAKVLPEVQEMLDELTGPQPPADMPDASGEGEDEEALLKTVKSERGRARIRSIIAARREAQERLARSEDKLTRFGELLRTMGMDMRDVAQLLHYGWLVGSGRPEYMRVALDKLNRERESLCRRLGMPQPGVDLFGDVPEIRDAYARRELRFDHALRLAEVERAERAMREREMLEAEKGQQAMALFSDMADFMKTLGRYLQPYAAQADHPAKMRRIYEYMSAPGWADEFVANVPRPMWARHVKYLYDNLALPPAKADTVTPVRSSPVAFGRPAGNPASTGEQRIMQRMEEMGL